MKKSVNAEHVEVALPKRSLSLEFWVGLFLIVAVAAVAYLAVGLGDIKIFRSNRYPIIAEFDNISGLKNGASVEIAGVPVGEVSAIELVDPAARLTLMIDNGVLIKDDDIASIRTKGIIGDRYIKISRGSSDVVIAPGKRMPETESVVDFEDIIGKIVHSLTDDKSEKGKDKE
ncbi:MAG: MCE family protein [Deltaproteobacteria bacterium]|nr:MCE family protein [Deltaproteobacteria bacterium]